MGIVYADLEVVGPTGRGTTRFLIDSGAVYSVLPETVWRALGRVLNPLRRTLTPMRMRLGQSDRRRVGSDLVRPRAAR